MTRLVMVEVKVVGMEISWKRVLENGADLCVNEGKRLNEYCANLAEGRKKKEKVDFLTVSGSVGRWPFLNVRVVFW